MVFVFGAQNPGAERDFETEKEIAKSLLNQGNVGDVRYGVVVYDHEGRPRLPLYLNVGKTALAKYLDDYVKWQREGTRMDKGVEKGIELLTQPGFVGAKKVLVVFTNGKISATDEEIKDVRKLAEDNGVQILVVGLGDQARRDQYWLLTDDIIMIDVTGDDASKVKDTAKEVAGISKKGKRFFGLCME